MAQHMAKLSGIGLIVWQKKEGEKLKNQALSNPIILLLKIYFAKKYIPKTENKPIINESKRLIIK